MIEGLIAFSLYNHLTTRHWIFKGRLFYRWRIADDSLYKKRKLSPVVSENDNDALVYVLDVNTICKFSDSVNVHTGISHVKSIDAIAASSDAYRQLFAFYKLSIKMT